MRKLCPIRQCEYARCTGSRSITNNFTSGVHFLSHPAASPNIEKVVGDASSVTASAAVASAVVAVS